MARLRNGFPRRADGSLGYRQAANQNAPQRQSPQSPANDNFRRNWLRSLDEMAGDLERWGSKRAARKALAELGDLLRNGKMSGALSLAGKLARRANALGIALDLAEMIGDALGIGEPGNAAGEASATKPQEVWPSKGDWQVTTDCPPDPPHSPFHYPNPQGSGCAVLFSQILANRNFYTTQTISGTLYRTMRTMRSAELGIDLGVIGDGDRGNTWQQFRMPEAQFQQNPAGNRRYGSQWMQTSAQAGVAGAVGQPVVHPLAPSIHPGAVSPLAPEYVPRAWPVWIGARPRPSAWVYGSQAGNRDPRETPRTRPRDDPRVEPAPAPQPGVDPAFPPAPQPEPMPQPEPGFVPAIEAWMGEARRPSYRSGQHQRRPPGRNEREGKMMSRAAGLVMGAFAAMTEVKDFVEAARDSLPASVRREVGWDPVAIAEAMWDHWSPELAARFLGNVVWNAVEDALVGRAIGAAQRYGRPWQNPFDGSNLFFGSSLRGAPVSGASYQVGAL